MYNPFFRYVKTALRHYRRQARTASLYAAGLTLGIGCALVIFLTVAHETRYDAHHTKRDQVYRVETKHLKAGFTTPGTYPELVNVLRREVGQIETVAFIWHEGGQLLLPAGSENPFKETIYFADKNLFNLFDYRWLAGSVQTALTEPNTVVLTRSFARKFFGTDAVLGKTIRYDTNKILRVTGVLDDYPVTTSFPLDVLISLPTLKQFRPDYDTHGWAGYGDNSQLYVLLKNGVQLGQLTGPLQTIAKKNLDGDAAQNQRFALNPLSEIHYSSNYSGRSADKKLLDILTLIGIIVLVIACINFINLTTAQALKRAKEIGVRKVIGSTRWGLVYQFLTEAGLVTLVAVVLSSCIIWLTLPSLAGLLAIPLTNADLLSPQTGLFLGGLFILTTLLAGAYPAFYLSGMAPMSVIRPVQQAKGQGLLRQGLVVVQFTVSLILIVSALLMSRQLSFFQNANLGFGKKAIITVGLPDNKPQTLQAFRQRLLESSQVEQVSFSLNTASSEGNWMENVQYRQVNKSVDVRTQMKFVDANFLSTYKISLLAGQAFREGDTLPKAIVNEVFLNRIGLQRAESAIGQTVYVGERALSVIGVVKNFHVNSLHQQIDPTLITVNPQHFYQGSIKLAGADLTSETLQPVLAHIKQSWSTTFPNQLFEYSFLDDTLNKAYRNERRTSDLIKAATSLAILLACLGLFGLAAFSAEQRIKEIGVRKVLGASVASIVALLSKDFLKLVLIAIVLASPLAYYAMHQWLADFAYKIDIEWWVFALAGLLAVGIALLTVSFQSIKAALMNPVKSLRSE